MILENGVFIMNNTFYKKLVMFFVLLLVLGGCTTGMRWHLFDISEIRYYYYDSETVKQTPDKTVVVRLASIIKNDEGRQWEFNERLKRGLPVSGYENYEYSEDIYELDCKKRLFQVLSGADYDCNGKELSAYVSPKLVWRTIPPGSAIETLLKFWTVCPTPEMKEDDKKPVGKKQDDALKTKEKRVRDEKANEHIEGDKPEDIMPKEEQKAPTTDKDELGTEHTEGL